MNFLNRCAVRANNGGSSSFTLTNAVPGFYTPPLCLNPSAVDGATYRYFAVSDDGTQHEEGDGVWDASESMLTRVNVRNSSNDGGPVFFSAAPIVYMGGPTADDIGGGTTSDILNVTGAGEAFEIESLRGIRQVNLTAPTAGSYEVNIAEYPIAGQAVEFILTDESDPSAEVISIDGRVYVGSVRTNITLSGSEGKSIVLLKLESNDWQVVDQDCKIAIGEISTVTGATLSSVDNQQTTPIEGSQVVPYFPRVILASSAGGAVNITFESGVISNPTLINFQQADPGDSFIVDPSNFRNLDGSTPSAITFDSDQECMSLFLYSLNEFLILSASPGVVTP